MECGCPGGQRLGEAGIGGLGVLGREGAQGPGFRGLGARARAGEEMPGTRIWTCVPGVGGVDSGVPGGGEGWGRGPGA